MNILIFVTTMLMLLSIMTYTKLQNFRDSQVFQIIFQNYMQDVERSYINEKGEDAYKDLKMSEKDTKPSPKVDANPRISIQLLFDPSRTSKEKEWEQTRILLKNLISTLYKEQPFYKKFEQERPGFLDDLIVEITREIDSLPPDKRPKNPLDLANLSLKDPKLDKVLYKMLHGASFMNLKTERQTQIAAEAETSVDDDDNSKQTDEYKSPEGYYSLLDYVTIKKPLRVRVYLASRPVLQSIFKDESTVNAIINEREQLYRLAMQDTPIDQLNSTFLNQFEKLKDPAIDPSSLNFSVSKTNPKGYR